MQEENCQCENSNRNIIYFLLFFLFGVFLVIFVKYLKNTQNIKSEEKQTEKRKKKELNNITERQRIILNALQRKKVASPSEIYSLVPNISTRTVRRDMDVLIKEGLVMQEGTTKSTMYRYIE